MVLIEVFLYLLAYPVERNSPLVNNIRTTVCTVCKHWHDIIVEYPKLWSTFRLYPIHQQVSSSILNTWLQRSANLPISIYINSRRGCTRRGWWTTESQLYHQELMSLFSQHITRWKIFDVESTGTLLNMVEDLDFTSAHLLEEVSLDIIHTIPQAMLCAFFALKGAPNITSLKYASSTIVTLSFQKYPDALALFKRLGVVGIKDCISASRALDIIRICESAERIHIHATRGMDGLEPTITASSEKLSILELTISTDEAGDMLGHLHLPHLKVLSVRCLNTGGFELARVISKLVGDRSRHTLQVLALDNISFDALEDLVVVQGLSRIPIVQFRLLTRQSH